MRIGVIVKQLKGGLGVYTSNLISNLLDIDKKNKYTLINLMADRGKIDSLKQIHHCKLIQFNRIWKDGIFANGFGIKFLPKLIKERMLPTNPINGYYIFRNHVLLPLRLTSPRFDEDLNILHGLSHFIPYFPIPNCKKIVSIHDIMPILLPQTYPKESVWHYKHVFVKMMEKVDRIIASSNNTKNDLIIHLKIPEEKITVVPLGVEGYNHKFLLTNREVKSDYILYVGSLEPTKNVSTLIKAYYKLRKKDIKHKLVIIDKNELRRNEIFELVKKLDMKKDVIFMSYLSNYDLASMYAHADLFVFPSIYEGFGLPVLEAMIYECPVITSNTSSLPEVVGEAGIMINPYKTEELTDAMHEVLTNEGLKRDMIKKGLKRVEMFSWKKTAKKTLKVYEEAMAE